MRLLGFLALLAALGLWTWSTASARSDRSDGMRPIEMRSKCPSGYRKSTVTARCVRNGARLPMLSWI